MLAEIRIKAQSLELKCFHIKHCCVIASSKKRHLISSSDTKPRWTITTLMGKKSRYPTITALTVACDSCPAAIAHLTHNLIHANPIYANLMRRRARRHFRILSQTVLSVSFPRAVKWTRKRVLMSRLGSPKIGSQNTQKGVMNTISDCIYLTYSTGICMCGSITVVSMLVFFLC